MPVTKQDLSKVSHIPRTKATPVDLVGLRWWPILEVNSYGTEKDKRLPTNQKKNICHLLVYHSINYNYKFWLLSSGRPCLVVNPRGTLEIHMRERREGVLRASTRNHPEFKYTPSVHLTINREDLWYDIPSYPILKSHPRCSPQPTMSDIIWPLTTFQFHVIPLSLSLTSIDWVCALSTPDSYVETYSPNVMISGSWGL